MVVPASFQRFVELQNQCRKANNKEIANENQRIKDPSAAKWREASPHFRMSASVRCHDGTDRASRALHCATFNCLVVKAKRKKEEAEKKKTDELEELHPLAVDSRAHCRRFGHPPPSPANAIANEFLMACCA